MKDKRPRVVVGVLPRRGKKYLLVKEKLEGGKEWWIVPGGGVEWGETIEEAIRRELMEETKLAAKKLTFLAHKEAVFPEVGYHTVIFFYEAQVDGKEPVYEKKIIEGGWFTADEAKRLDLVESAQWLFHESGLI